MKARHVLILIAGSAALLTACSSSPPRAPMGLEKRPANSPETIAQLSRPSRSAASSVSPLSMAAEAPRVPAPEPLPAPANVSSEKMTISDLNAPRGPASLSDQDQQKLVTAAISAQMITLHARTDRRTPAAGATQAAIARAVSVKRFLVGQGVPEGRIRLMYRSTGDFVTPNRTAAQQAANRRVEIEFR